MPSWIMFKDQDGRRHYRRMVEADAALLANEKGWMTRSVDPDFGSLLDNLVAFEDRWVTVSSMLGADPFPDHLG